MSETNNRFHRSAMRAAGPVFFVSFGILLLVVLGFLLLFGPPPAGIAWILGVVGAGSLVLGLILGRVDSATDSKTMR